MARPTKYEPEYAKQAELFAAYQMTLTEMAAFWRVDPDTVTNWKREHPEFVEALEYGKSAAIAGAAQVLFEDAMKAKNPASARYILENLKRDAWSSRQTVDQTVTVRRGIDLQSVDESFWGKAQITSGSGGGAGDPAPAQLPEGVPAGQEQVPAVGEESKGGGELASST